MSNTHVFFRSAEDGEELSGDWTVGPVPRKTERIKVFQFAVGGKKLFELQGTVSSVEYAYEEHDCARVRQKCFVYVYLEDLQMEQCGI